MPTREGGRGEGTRDMDLVRGNRPEEGAREHRRRDKEKGSKGYKSEEKREESGRRQ